MSLDVIKTIAKDTDNEALLTAINAVEVSNKSNLDRIGFLEQDLNKAIAKRDGLSTLVKDTFGISEINEDSLSTFKNGVSDSDKVLKAENDNLTAMANELKAERDSLSNSLNKTKNSYAIERSLVALGASSDTANTKAYNILLDEVSNTAYIDDGSIVFKANDGTTVRNTDGSPMSMSDRYAQIKDSDEFSFLFKPQGSKKGSGNQGSKKGGGNPTSLKGLNDVERIRLYKQDPELFKRLAQQ